MPERFVPLSDRPGGCRISAGSADLREEVLFSQPAAPRASGAFRRLPRSPAAAADRAAQVLSVNRSEDRLDFSPSTSLFAFQVPLKRLPLALDHLSILFLTDIHLKHSAPQRAQETMALVGFLKSRNVEVDVVAFGGDAIDVKRSDLHFECLAALASLAPHGRRIAVLGNHDYYGKSEKIVRACLGAAGFADIEGAVSGFSVEGSRINFFGLGDKRQGHAQLSQYAAEREGDINVLLTHTLDNVTRKVPDCFDLILSGHFHGGEIKIGPFSGVHFLRMRALARDINRQTEGWDMLTDRALSYVSPGFARHAAILHNCRPGAALLELRSA